MTRAIRRIILHTSYTPASMHIGAETIRRWHVEENGWDDIGYHFVIRRDGTLERGRPVADPGAHTHGHNEDSVGLVLVGGQAEGKDDPELNYTPAQWDTLRTTVLALLGAFGLEPSAVSGHRDWAPRWCPGFDVAEWAASHLGG